MMAYAKITQVLENQVKITLHSDNAESNIPYYYLSSYQPALNDTVLVDTHLKIIIGKVVV